MVRTLVGVLFAAVAVDVLAGQQPRQPQGRPQEPGQGPSVFRGVGDLVRAYVTVTDKDGRLVTTLRQNDFEIRDDGKAQPLALFDNSPRAIRLIVLIDVSGSMTGNVALLRQGTVELVKYLRPEDGARVGTFGDDVVISPTFTRDAGDLVTTLPTEIKEDVPTPLWRAVDKAMEVFAAEPVAAGADARNVVVVLSDGADEPPPFKGRFVSQAEVIDRARRQDVMIYGIGVRGRAPLQRIQGGGVAAARAALELSQPDPGLARVAEESGGGYTEIGYGENLGLVFARVAEELHTRYLLGYDPSKRDGKVHKIDIRVMQSGMKARGRKDYVAPKN